MDKEETDVVVVSIDKYSFDILMDKLDTYLKDKKN